MMGKNHTNVNDVFHGPNVTVLGRSALIGQ